MIATSDAPPALTAAAVAKVKVAVTLDSRGRVRVTPEQRRQILVEFARSAESAPHYARRMGLKYSTFAAWVARERRRNRSAAAKPPLRLLEAVLPPAAINLPLRVELPGGARVECRDVSQMPLLVALLQALAKPC